MAWPGRTSSSPPSCSTCSAPLSTSVYSSKSGRWPGSTQPEGERMWATLTRSSPLLTRPAYSSISFGLVPAASTRLGLSIRSGIAARLQPLADLGGRPALERLEQLLRRGGDVQRGAMLLAQEALPDGVVEQRGQAVVVAADVEDAHRLVVQAELAPGVDLDQLLERAGAAGERDERIREVGHEGLALVHRADLVELRQPLMGDLAPDEVAGDDTDHLAAVLERRVGHDPHQADVRAAVDDADAAARQRAREAGRRRGVGGVAPRVGSGVHAHPHGCHATGMETTKLGPLDVTRLCLGTMLMGGKTPVEESHRMLDRYLDAGGNFIDTADVYGDG